MGLQISKTRELASDAERAPHFGASDQTFPNLGQIKTMPNQFQPARRHNPQLRLRFAIHHFCDTFELDQLFTRIDQDTCFLTCRANNHTSNTLFYFCFPISWHLFSHCLHSLPALALRREQIPQWRCEEARVSRSARPLGLRRREIQRLASRNLRLTNSPSLRAMKSTGSTSTWPRSFQKTKCSCRGAQDAKSSSKHLPQERRRTLQDTRKVARKDTSNGEEGRARERADGKHTEC